MPYSSVDEVPSYVKKKGTDAAKKWIAVWNSVFEDTGSESKAFAAANGAIGLTEIVMMSELAKKLGKPTDPFFLLSDAFKDWNAAGKYEVQVFRTGLWEGHPEYGDILITKEDVRDVMRNWMNSSRRLVLDYDHGTDYGVTDEERKAAGWLIDLWVEDTKGNEIEFPNVLKTDAKVLVVKAEYEVTPRCNDYIKNGEFMLYSPTFNPDFVNKETGKSQGMTLLRGAITNSPFFDGMQEFRQVAASDATAARLYRSTEKVVAVKLMECYKGTQFVVEYTGQGGTIEDKIGAFDSAGMKIISMYAPLQPVGGEQYIEQRDAANPGQRSAGGTEGRSDGDGAQASHTDVPTLEVSVDEKEQAEQKRLLAEKDAKIAALEASAKKAAEDQRAKEAKAFVQTLVDDYKIKASARETWEKRYIADPEDAKALAEGLETDPTKKKGEVGAGGDKSPGVDVLTEIEPLIRTAKMTAKENGETITEAVAQLRVFAARPDLAKRYRRQMIADGNALRKKEADLDDEREV